MDSGGTPITGYSVRVVLTGTDTQVGTLRPAGACATSLTVTGLTNGTPYQFQVLATNSSGPGPYSALSNAVVPIVTAAVTRLSDFNRDGFTDLVARDAAGLLWLWPLTGNAVFGARTQIGTGWNGFTILGPGDFSGDGRADILVRDTTGSLLLYRGNGTGGVAPGIVVGIGWQGMTALVTPGNSQGPSCQVVSR